MSRTPDEIRAGYAEGRPKHEGDQELLNIGHECHANKCGLVSYLTIECDFCKERFCEEHKRPEWHACPNWDPNAIDKTVQVIECEFSGQSFSDSVA